MNWLSTLVRVAGSTTPWTAPLVQLQAELDSAAFNARLKALEDPLTRLHPDIPEISRLIYEALARENNETIRFDDAVYKNYARPIALLETRGLIACARRLGNPIPLNVSISSPEYVLLYLCPRFEESGKMAALIQAVDGLANGGSLDGKRIASDLQLPVPVVRASFAVYEKNGFGFTSREVGSAYYRSRT